MPGTRLPAVAHVVPALFDPEDGILGGAERYAFELARHMAVRTPTRLVTFGARARRYEVGALHVVVLHAHHVRGQRTNPFSWRLWRELGRADVVHCHQQHVAASSFAAALSRLGGRRVFATDLGGGGLDVSSFVSTDRWYHGHLHISEYSRCVFGHGSSPHARVILGGVDLRRFSPGGEPGDHVLFVGRLLPHKGVHDLIAALPAGMPLRIVGSVQDRAYLDMLRARAAGRRVTFVHDACDSQLVEEYRRARAVVLPSVYTTADGRTTAVPELLGQTLLEGMACARPAICTSVASLPEVVSDGETGFVVPPGNPVALGAALARLAADPDTGTRIGRAARARVESLFRWEQVVERCFAAYDAAGRSMRPGAA